MKIGAKIWFWLIIIFNTPLTVGKIAFLFYNTGYISSLIVSCLYLAGAILLLNEKRLGAYLLFFGAAVNLLTSFFLSPPTTPTFGSYYSVILTSFSMILITYVLVIRQWDWFD